MYSNLVYQIALTQIPNIGAVQAKILLQHFDVDEIFKAKKSSLEKIEGIGSIKANSIKEFHDFSIAEDEIKFIEKYNIKPLFITDDNYPKRLLNCYDSPTMLYYKGDADLNASKVISIIGTRDNSDYGKKITEKLISDLSDQDIMVVSGLAFGIDTIAHKASLKNNVKTVAVLAHGLDTIYPSENSNIAKEMLNKGGGLLTEYKSKSKPDKHNFPIRNRIVAGMSDATIVVESGVKGGSMITVELANGYNKDVFAFPGKTSDLKSIGCNHLIKNNKAILLTDADQLLEMMGWKEIEKKKSKKPKELFIELTDHEKIIVQILKEKGTAGIDEINLSSGLNSSFVAAAILNLELQSVINALPGKMYQLY
jgi:DNA processing protein